METLERRTVHSDYFLCSCRDDAITTMLPDQAEASAGGGLAE
jgi:hypothetical protein